MRVQQQGQALRLRVDVAELAQLLAGETVVNVTRWPDGRVDTQRVVLAEAENWQRQSDGWLVELPADEVREFVTRLPSREGLCYALEGLGIRFDVDVRDSARKLKESGG